ncbi:cupredoxin domain-containing protein [Thioalkalivibrio thiocyanodenitrificans]|uniref:cupredoxin domain-containing protein n=1 Tax=Thioalkalivibrio thiocyanodenitrificans TaxID=243063 RepID=UPI00036DA4B1|nr:cupredoxin domain-containing protein [Thioalkalivibrio thiocyanodenitrificans]
MRWTLLCGVLLAMSIPAPALANGDTVTVEMIDYGYSPAELEIPAGTTVRWVNMERRTSHDVYFPDEDLGSERLFPEEHWERRFDNPGTYAYHCRPHESRDMQGVIRVIAND